MRGAFWGKLDIPNPTPQEAVQILKDARTHLTTKWFQGGMWRLDGEVFQDGPVHQHADGLCCMGAMIMAIWEMGIDHIPISPVLEHLGFPDVERLAHWNDLPTTTHPMVLERFDNAIHRAQAFSGSV